MIIGLSRVEGDDLDHGHVEYEYSPYHYEYKVHDDKEYLDFGQKEEDDGQGNVHGYYHVQLPDGRHQRVDYHVTGHSGYIADVTYDGEASHPTHHSSGHHGPNIPIKKLSEFSFGRQGKSLNFEDDESISQKSESFGEVDRKGKSLTFKSKTIDIPKSEPNPIVHPIKSLSHDTGHFTGFARQEKSLNSEAAKTSGFESTSTNIDSDLRNFGHFQSSVRKAKSQNNGLKGKQKMSNLI